MSDEIAANAAPAEVIEAPAEVEGDIFADDTFDKEFGLEAEDGQSAEVQPDEPVVTDPPVLRQDEEVTPEKVEVETEGVVTPEAETEAKTDDLKFNEKLNWDDDKVPFREEYKNLKQAYLNLVESSVEAQFIANPTEFKDYLKQTSPTSYLELGELIATESADTNPKEWLEYLAAKEPDLLAEIATGREGMTAERLKAEMEILLDEDDEDVKAAIEKNRSTAEKPEETPQEKRVRELLEKEEQRELRAITSEVFQPIEQEIDSLVSDAGLEIKETVDWAKFDQLDDETKFKVVVNELLPMWIDKRVQTNPKLVSMQARLQEFIGKKDKTSAATLSHPAKIAATNFASELLSILTGKKAKLKKSETESPTSEKPKPLIKSASGNGAVPDLGGAPDWGVTEADLFSR